MRRLAIVLVVILSASILLSACSGARPASQGLPGKPGATGPAAGAEADQEESQDASGPAKVRTGPGKPPWAGQDATGDDADAESPGGN